MISELLFDPSPPVGLPEAEYVEWYNPGPDTVELRGWQWAVGEEAGRVKGVKIVEGVRMAPGEYIVVCGKGAAEALRPFGRVLVLDPFPALKNTGDRLTLLDPEGREVHSVAYSSDSYTDALKADGGWSLELADLKNFCSDSAWVVSDDPSGGTPGRANSRSLTLASPEAPVLLRAGLYDPQTIFVLFSGPLKPGLDMNNYAARLQPGGWVAEAAPPARYGFPGLFFRLPAGLADTTVYSLELSGAPCGCGGAGALLRLAGFSLPREPDSAGVVINEVMFDPGTGNPEWVELFNRGTKTVELNGMILARADTSGSVISFSNSQELPFLLFPGSYAVLTASISGLKKNYPDMDPVFVCGRPDMPALSNSASRLILLDGNQRVIDQAAYDPDWHYPYLEETKGVSLERIRPDVSGLEMSSWFSAGRLRDQETGRPRDQETVRPGDQETVRLGDGGTPGYRNSQYLINTSPPLNNTSQYLTTPHFSLQTPHLYAGSLADPVPVLVRYTFPERGWFCGLEVFDQRGARVRVAAPFDLAGVEGVMQWDGLDEMNRLVPDGIYLLVAEFRHPSGKTGRWKKACGVVRVH